MSSAYRVRDIIVFSVGNGIDESNAVVLFRDRLDSSRRTVITLVSGEKYTRRRGGKRIGASNSICTLPATASNCAQLRAYIRISRRNFATCNVINGLPIKPPLDAASAFRYISMHMKSAPDAESRENLKSVKSPEAKLSSRRTAR